MSDNNTLKAISVTKDDKVIVNYSLSSAIDNFRTGTFVYELDDKSQDHIMVEEIVNGSKPLDVTLQSKCGDCSLQNFTYSLADAGCGRIDASCVATCCVPCGWGGGVPCLLIWCPTCLFLCCDGPPGGSKCYSCA